MTRTSLVLILAALSGCLIITDGDSTLTVKNRSSWALDEVHLAATGEPSWGPNLLPYRLYPGEDLVIDGIDCDRYDVEVVDQTGRDCVLPNLHLCFDDHTWVITDSGLAICAWGQ